MKKKIGELTLNDIILLCQKKDCSECPISPYLEFDCSDFKRLDIEVIEKEVEIDE